MTHLCTLYVSVILSDMSKLINFGHILRDCGYDAGTVTRVLKITYFIIQNKIRGNIKKRGYIKK